MKTITFYSYKGGVGRTLALANIATRLVEFKKKVCLLDFDLEAPGLPYKFLRLNKQGIKKGIVDYIYDYSNAGKLGLSIGEYAIKFNPENNIYPIHLIPAGDTESKDYWKKLSSINWYELLYESKNGLAFFLDLKEKIKRDLNPDFLLIDSRTGISEMAGITLSLLADEVVIVAANNQENLNGARKIINSIANAENQILKKAPKISFVLSRIPFTENPEDKAKEQKLLTKIRRTYLPSTIQEISVIHSDRELEENERLKIGYEKDESTAQISRDYLNLFEKITKDDLTDDEVNKFKQIKESEKFFIKAISSQSLSERLRLISKAIEVNENIEFYYFRALTHRNLLNYEDALKDCKYILENNSKNVPALLLKSEILLDLKKLNEAKESYNNVLNIDSTNYEAIIGLALVCYELDDIDETIKLYTKAIEISPERPEAYNGRGNSKRLKEEYDDALKDTYKALELNPDFAIAFCTLAEINAQLGKIEEFYLNLERALKIDAQNIEQPINREKIYLKFSDDLRFQKLLEKYNISYNYTKGE